MISTPARAAGRKSPYSLPPCHDPRPPKHHSLGPSKDTQGRPSTIPSISASPGQSGKEKAMSSTVHALSKSAYKTFQANPGMATLPTPKKYSHTPRPIPTNRKPHRQISSVHQLSVKPSASWKTTRCTPTLPSAHHATTPKPNRNVPNPFLKSFD